MHIAELDLVHFVNLQYSNAIAK